jgi:hypothetical protein
MCLRLFTGIFDVIVENDALKSKAEFSQECTPAADYALINPTLTPSSGDKMISSQKP